MVSIFDFNYLTNRKPPDHETLTRYLHSGRHVPISSPLLDFLSVIVPPSQYKITEWIDIPEFQHKRKKLRSIMHKDFEVLISHRIRDYGDECAMPSIHTGLETDCDDSGVWYFSKLRVVAVQLHPAWDEYRIAYYEEKMREDEDYIPACILLAPPAPYPYFSIGGVVLDGHHKLVAASNLQRPLRVILVEMRNSENETEPALPFLNPTSELLQKTRNNLSSYF